MQEIRNLEGKLVCRIDPQDLVVEIIVRGHKTLIIFMLDNDPIITNSKAM